MRAAQLQHTQASSSPPGTSCSPAGPGHVSRVSRRLRRLRYTYCCEQPASMDEKRKAARQERHATPNSHSKTILLNEANILSSEQHQVHAVLEHVAELYAGRAPRSKAPRLQQARGAHRSPRTQSGTRPGTGRSTAACRCGRTRRRSPRCRRRAARRRPCAQPRSALQGVLQGALSLPLRVSRWHGRARLGTHPLVCQAAELLCCRTQTDIDSAMPMR